MPKKISDEDEIIVCLYDGKYHYGVAALANSLAKSNFKGIVNIAYSDFLPFWINQLQVRDKCSYYLTNEIIIYFERVEPNMHLAYYKPYFIKHTIAKFPQATKFFYFDVDIVVVAPWEFFSDWLGDEVCLCLDNSFEFVHINHPWRRDWKKLSNVESNFFNPITDYVNSGFIAIKRNNLELIDKWIELTECYRTGGANLKEINQEGHNSFKGDQDLLNAAITVSPDVKLSLIGKEGYGVQATCLSYGTCGG